MSWNLRNYTGSSHATSDHALGHDLDALREHLGSFDADAFCFQEVANPASLGELLPGYDLAVSVHGGRHDQYLVHACRHSLTSGTHAYSDRRLDEDGALRPALVSSITFGGASWSLVSVHLKATPSGLATRRRQWDQLTEMLNDLPRPRLLAGDFNTATGAGEIDALVRRLAECGMDHVPLTLPCTAAWDGRRRDRWKEPSTLDHIFIEARADRPAPWVQAAPGTHCRSHRCEVFSSSAGYPDIGYERVSDHCPLRVDIPAER